MTQLYAILEVVYYMRCIFCKCGTSDSISVEHIIPESLGNKEHTLPRGVVCDKCNNYLAREVEKPFLEHDSIRALRFEEGVLSKKGRVPTIDGILLHDQEPSIISVTRPPEFPGTMLAQEPLFLEYKGGTLPEKEGKIIMPIFNSSTSFPNGSILSRFLGKIALEVMAFRLLDHPEFIEELINTTQLDDLRDHVRYGKIQDWPCNVRQIYNKNVPLYDDKTGELYQIINEFEILHTEFNEYYLVLALFGIELVINLGGAVIEGYHSWLEQHQNKSPLYVKP